MRPFLRDITICRQFQTSVDFLPENDAFYRIQFFLRQSLLLLWIRTGQTDRRTDRRLQTELRLVIQDQVHGIRTLKLPTGNHSTELQT